MLPHTVLYTGTFVAYITDTACRVISGYYIVIHKDPARNQLYCRTFEAGGVSCTFTEISGNGIVHQRNFPIRSGTEVYGTSSRNIVPDFTFKCKGIAGECIVDECKLTAYRFSDYGYATVPG